MIYLDGFCEVPSRLAGNTQSFHEVVFGTYDGIDVAIKPYKDDGQGIRECMRLAEHEESMYERVGELGYLTFITLGILESKDAALLVTKYEPDIMSATTLPIGEVGRKFENEIVIDPSIAISGIATTIAHLHNDAITHGDAKPRNFSFHRRTGIGPIVLDLEAARDHRKSGKRNEYFVNSVRNDLRSMTYSLGYQGFGGKNMKGAWGLLDEIVLDPYHEIAEQPLPATTIISARNGLMEGRGVFFSDELNAAKLISES